MQYLAELGAEVNTTNSDGWTPLHSAIEGGLVEVAKRLMLYAASLDVRLPDGRLPIDMARNEEMRQAIWDDEKRRRDHGFKRAVPDAPRAAAAAASALVPKQLRQRCHRHLRHRLRLRQLRQQQQQVVRSNGKKTREMGSKKRRKRRKRRTSRADRVATTWRRRMTSSCPTLYTAQHSTAQHYTALHVIVPYRR